MLLKETCKLIVDSAISFHKYTQLFARLSYFLIEREKRCCLPD